MTVHVTFLIPLLARLFRLRQELSFFVLCAFLFAGTSLGMDSMNPLRVSENGRYFETAGGQPFFWMGDTAWLLVKNLDRAEIERFLEDRREKEFNVIQIMVIHDLGDSTNAYGKSAVQGSSLDQLLITPGNEPGEGEAYDYWDHLEFAIETAREKGLFMALVPIWGSNIKEYHVTAEAARAYGAWLAARLSKHPNIIWLNGGDIDAALALDVWEALADGIRSVDTTHLMTYHPRGRMHSSMWFHDRDWLDFNMFQSGHRTYEQDDTALNYGEDNWRFVTHDWNLTPAKPTLDGEPSYEHIPHGLHDVNAPLWYGEDLRRYAYWSVFAGAAGFTYGNNAIMQFYSLSEQRGAFGAAVDWRDELNATGAWQMRHLRRLIESKPMLERVPAQELIVQYNTRDRYAWQVATRGTDYAFIYTYTGDPIRVQPGILPGEELSAAWFNPRNGGKTPIGVVNNREEMRFVPAGKPDAGNDWVLILESVKPQLD